MIITVSLLIRIIYQCGKLTKFKQFEEILIKGKILPEDMATSQNNAAVAPPFSTRGRIHSFRPPRFLSAPGILG